MKSMRTEKNKTTEWLKDITRENFSEASHLTLLSKHTLSSTMKKSVRLEKGSSMHKIRQDNSIRERDLTLGFLTIKAVRL